MFTAIIGLRHVKNNGSKPGRMDILMFVNDQIKGFIIKKDFPEPPVDAEPGDVIILRNDRMLREPTYHAGVCCADGEVIHLSGNQQSYLTLFLF